MVSLEDEGIVVRSKNDRYDLARDLGYYKGIISIHPKGFGFVEVSNSDEEIYIDQDNMNGAIDDDIVLVEITSKMNIDRLEGRILKIVKRQIEQYIGEIHELYHL